MPAPPLGPCYPSGVTSRDLAPCPICGADSGRLFAARYGPAPKVAGVPIELAGAYSIHECQACDFRFTHPGLPKEKLDACYRQAGTRVWADAPDNAWRRRFPELVRSVRRYASETSILEVGCYTGALLKCFPKEWDKFGVEPSEAAADEARQAGIEILGNDITTTELPPGRFGCVASLSVLEHIATPRPFLEKLLRALAPGGILVLQTGDFNSFFAKRMNGHWCYYHKPEHMSFFSFEGLERLLACYGVEVVGASRNVYHKRPSSTASWLVHGSRVARAVSRRLVSRGASLPENGVPWVTCCDHMVVLGRMGTGASQS